MKRNLEEKKKNLKESVYPPGCRFQPTDVIDSDVSFYKFGAQELVDRRNRVPRWFLRAKNGYWKTTYGEKKIKDNRLRHTGGAKRVKTNWIMDEYLLDNSEKQEQNTRDEERVLCGIFNRMEIDAQERRDIEPTIATKTPPQTSSQEGVGDRESQNCTTDLGADKKQEFDWASFMEKVWSYKESIMISIP